MNMRKFTSIIIIFVCLLISVSEAELYSQPAEITDTSLKRAELLEGHGQEITNPKSSLSILKEELKTLKAARDKLIEDKVEGEALELATKQKSVVEDRINILNETVRARLEMKEVADSLDKALKITTALTDQKNKISEEAALLPASQFESIQKETELLKARLEAITATVKEKEIYLLTAKTSLDASKLKLEEEKKKFRDKLKALISQKPLTQEEAYQSENRNHSLENEIKLQDDKLNLLLIQNELAKLNLQTAQAKKLNTQMEIDIKTGIAGTLSQKFKEAEDQRKEKEAEEARQVEDERRRIVEEEKARAELEKKEALKKQEIAVQKQLEETSPEKKRVLEIEADVHKQQGLIATIKDELITAGIESHKDRTEFKIIQKNIEEILGGENTPEELFEDLNKIDLELKRIQEKINTIQSLHSSAEKQRSIIVESLENARAELLPSVSGQKASIEKEVESFSDKALGKQLITLVNLRVKNIEEQNNLVETKIERLNERLELNKGLLEKLTETQETISQIRAANVWARRENKISTNTVIVAISDLKILKNKPFDFYQASVRNFRKLGIYLSDKRNITAFVVKILIIIVIVALVYFIRSYLSRWATQKKDKFTILTPRTFSSFKLIPGMFRIMQGTMSALFLFIIALSVRVTFTLNAPVVLSFIYGLAIVTVYKLLKGFLIESLSPHMGIRRWITITYSSARHIFRGLSVILLFSAVTITIISVLNAYDYKRDVIELLWFIYRIVLLWMFIWIAVSQKSYLLKILPYTESALGKFINKLINLLYPLFVLFIILLFALRSLGYALLTYTFMATLIKSVFIAIITYLVYRYLLMILLQSREKLLRQSRMFETKESELEENVIRSRFRVYKYLLDYGTVIISVIVILVIWNDTFKDVVSSPAAPKVFRGVYERILYVLISIKNGLTHRFMLADGRYTTPFKIIFGILVLVAAFIFARYLKNVLQKRFYEKAALEKGAQQAISSGVRYFIIGIAAVIGLNVAGIPLRSLTIFAGAFGIGIGFGMQNIINNFVSGLILFAERPIKIGDLVEIDKLYGTVEHIGARSTRIRSSQNTHIIVPNSSFLQNNVLNWTLSDNLIRTSIKVGVVYGSPTREVERLLCKAVEENEKVLKIPEPVLLFTDFGDNSLDFEVHFWIVVKAMFDRRKIESDLRYQIDSLFRDAGIVIAFPQRDVHLDSHKPIEVRVVGDGKVKDKPFTGIRSPGM